MIEYIYKGFMISYKITPAALENNSFQADGSVTYLLNRPKSFSSQQFHTEFTTHVGAEHEIKKLLENYVDFELKNFYDRKKAAVEKSKEGVY